MARLRRLKIALFLLCFFGLVIPASAFDLFGSSQQNAKAASKSALRLTSPQLPTQAPTEPFIEQPCDSYRQHVGLMRSLIEQFGRTWAATLGPWMRSVDRALEHVEGDVLYLREAKDQQASEHLALQAEFHQLDTATKENATRHDYEVDQMKTSISEHDDAISSLCESRQQQEASDAERDEKVTRMEVEFEAFQTSSQRQAQTYSKALEQHNSEQAAAIVEASQDITQHMTRKAQIITEAVNDSEERTKQEMRSGFKTVISTMIDVSDSLKRFYEIANYISHLFECVAAFGKDCFRVFQFALALTPVCVSSFTIRVVKGYLSPFDLLCHGTVAILTIWLLGMWFEDVPYVAPFFSSISNKLISATNSLPILWVLGKQQYKWWMPMIVVVAWIAYFLVRYFSCRSRARQGAADVERANGNLGACERVSSGAIEKSDKVVMGNDWIKTEKGA